MALSCSEGKCALRNYLSPLTLACALSFATRLSTLSVSPSASVTTLSVRRRGANRFRSLCAFSQRGRTFDGSPLYLGNRVRFWSG